MYLLYGWALLLKYMIWICFQTKKLHNDIQVIPVHAETGERVLPKDKEAILEIFKPGQRPGGVLIDVAPGMDKKTKAPNRGLALQGLY